MIIYLRHGKDAHVDGYSHDEVLTEEGKAEIEEFTRKMVDENGLPDIVYVSPFYRTRQTLKHMLNVIKNEYNATVKIKVDRKLGRYFSEKEQKKEMSGSGLHRSTMKKNPLIQETQEEFKARVQKFHEKILRKYSGGDKNVWNITHSLVIVRIIKYHSIERSFYIQYLDVVKLE